MFTIIITIEIFLFFAVGVTYIYQTDQLARLEAALKHKKLNNVLKEDNDYENILKEEIEKLGIKSKDTITPCERTSPKDQRKD